MQHNITKTKQEISGHRPLTQTTVQGKTALLIGIIVAALGFYIFAIANGWIAVKKSSIKAPLWVLKACGIVFFCPGLFLFVYGIRGVLRQHRNKLMSKLHPQHPWRYDYPWNEQRIEGRRKVGILSGISFVIFVAIFMSPFYWLLQQAKGFTYYFLCFFAFFGGLIILIGVVTTIRSIIQYFKYGKSYLHFKNFPFYLGKMLDVDLQCPRGIGEIKELAITLRYVEEQIEIRGSGEDESEKIVSYSLYRDQIVISESLKHSAGESIPISFELPEDGATNDLLNHPAKYWEIAVKAETIGIDFESTYLLPVYKET